MYSVLICFEINPFKTGRVKKGADSLLEQVSQGQRYVLENAIQRFCGICTSLIFGYSLMSILHKGLVRKPSELEVGLKGKISSKPPGGPQPKDLDRSRSFRCPSADTPHALKA